MSSLLSPFLFPFFPPFPNLRSRNTFERVLLISTRKSCSNHQDSRIYISLDNIIGGDRSKSSKQHTERAYEHIYISQETQYNFIRLETNNLLVRFLLKYRFARHRVTMSSSYSKESIARGGRDKKSWSYRVTSTGLFVSGVERKRGREIIFGGDNLSVAIERRHFSSGLSLVQVHSWRARTGVRRITRSAAYAHIYTFIYIYMYVYTHNIHICMRVRI